MSPAKKYIIALFVVFLHYAPQIAARTVEANRYYDLWGASDAAAIILGMLLLAGLLLGLDAVVSRLGSPTVRRLFNHLYLVALTSGLLAAVPAFVNDHPNVVQLIWMGAMAVIGFSFGWPRSRLVRWAGNCCLIFSPAVVLVSIQMFTWSTWSATAESLPVAREPGQELVSKPVPRDAARGLGEGRSRLSDEPGDGTPVFLFVFDEWSYTRSTKNDQFRPCFKNVRKLCQQAVMYCRALSPGDCTMQSLPRIIFQRDKEFVLRDGGTFFEDGQAMVPTDRGSLFEISRGHDYTSYLLGWYHPYRHVLGEQVDYCHAYSRGPQEPGPATRVAWRFYTNLQYFSDPISRRISNPLEEHFVSRHWFEMAHRYREEMLEILKQSPGKSFAMFHAPWPHAPFVFNADGSYSGALLDMTLVDDYLRQLEYVDVIVGQIVETLCSAGKFDDAVVILTSDHGWRYDPDPAYRQEPQWKRRVPLIIKLPAQKSGCLIKEEFCTNQLGPLLKEVFAGNTDTQELLQLVRGTGIHKKARGPAAGTTSENTLP